MRLEAATTKATSGSNLDAKWMGNDANVEILSLIFIRSGSTYANTQE